MPVKIFGQAVVKQSDDISLRSTGIMKIMKTVVGNAIVLVVSIIHNQ